MLKVSKKNRATFKEIEENLEEYPSYVKEPKFPQVVEVYLQQSDNWYLQIRMKRKENVDIKLTRKQAKELYEYGIIVGERG